MRLRFNMRCSVAGDLSASCVTQVSAIAPAKMMSDSSSNKASPGMFRVICDANYGGPYWGSAECGEYSSLVEARAVAQGRVDSHPTGTASCRIYDDQGKLL